MSFDKGVTTLKSALGTASKNDPDAFKQCFPDLADFMENYEARSAEYKRRAEAAAAYKREQEAERQSPHGQVREGYALYRLVRHCNETRRGYVVQYVNDDELNRATASIQKLVKKAKKDEPNISTDNLWNESAALADGRPIGNKPCQNYLRQLLEISPVYNDEKPPE